MVYCTVLGNRENVKSKGEGTSIVLRTTRADVDLQFKRQRSADDVSHKPIGRLPLLAARPAVIFPVS